MIDVLVAISILFGGTTEIIEDNHHLIEKAKIQACLQSKDCRYLSEAAYYESRGERDYGVMAVMKTIINRVRHPRFPDTIKDVVIQQHAFSYRHDGSMKRDRQNPQQWARMRLIAFEMLSGERDIDVGGATHYHATRVNPYWSRQFDMTMEIDRHRFYACTGYC